MASVRAARRAVVIEAPAPLNALICGTLPAVLATFVAAVVLLQQHAAAAPLLPRREGEGSPTAAPGAPAGSSLASSAATAAGSCAAGSFLPTGSRAARTGALNGLRAPQRPPGPLQRACACVRRKTLRQHASGQSVSLASQ